MRAVLQAVGDNLIHLSVLLAAKKADGSYDFRRMYDPVRKLLSAGNINVLNQETILIKDPRKHDGYPFFGSPFAVGDAVRDAGFNVITHATNHAYDKEEEGIRDSCRYWQQYPEITLTGIHFSRKSADKISAIQKNGISVACLNYTAVFNDGNPPLKKEYYIDSLLDMEKVCRDIVLAKRRHDFVVVFPHWGEEYRFQQNEQQEAQAKQMADAGADLLIGTHPHYIQPFVTVTASDGRVVPVFYSLGNFLSNQEDVSCMLGAMARVTLVKERNRTGIENACAIPLVTHKSADLSRYAIYPLSEYTKELASAHKLRETKGEEMSLPHLKDLWEKVMGSEIHL